MKALLFALMMGCHLYPTTAIITDIHEEVVTVTGLNGEAWSFVGAEDYEVGDVCSMIMSDNKTQTIYDDEIMIVRYVGHVGE